MLAQLRVDDGPVVEVRETNGPETAATEMEFPSDAKTLQVGQTRTINGDVTESDISHQLHNMAPHTAILFDETLPFAQRLRHFHDQHKTMGTDCDVEPPLHIYLPRRVDPKGLSPLDETARTHGVAVPAALQSYSEVRFEANMGGGSWIGVGSWLYNADYPDNSIMPNVAMAQREGAEWAQLTPDAYAVIMALFERAVTVMGDANHFTGIIWDPVGLSAREARHLGFETDLRAPDGMFWCISGEDY